MSAAVSPTRRASPGAGKQPGHADRGVRPRGADLLPARTTGESIESIQARGFVSSVDLRALLLEHADLAEPAIAAKTSADRATLAMDLDWPRSGQPRSPQPYEQ